MQAVQQRMQSKPEQKNLELTKQLADRHKQVRLKVGRNCCSKMLRESLNKY